MDSQGRLLIHQLLRKSASLKAEVVIMGYLTYLEIWDRDHFETRLLAEPYTAQDEATLARLGV